MKQLITLIAMAGLAVLASGKDLAEYEKRAAEKLITKIKGVDPKDVRLAIKPDTEATFFAITDQEILYCGEGFRAEPIERFAWSAIDRVEATPDMFETKPSFLRGHVAGIRLRFKEPVKFGALLKYFDAGKGIFVFTPVVVVRLDNGLAAECTIAEKTQDRFQHAQRLEGLLKEHVKQ